MAVLGKDTKQPAEIDSWDVDFADWMPAGDGIDIVETDIRQLSGPSGPPLHVQKTESTSTLTKVWLFSGVDGARYRVQVRATTMQGRVKEAEFDISVKEI